MPCRLLPLLTAAAILASQAAHPRPADPADRGPPGADVDPRRSLFVTELEVLEQALGLEDVLTALADDVGNPAFDPLTLWRQLWDTQNVAPGLGLGFNCDDETDYLGAPAINGFPIQCPRNEGGEIDVDPFDPAQPSYYRLIALVNRMDLAPLDGADCGSFRAIFARAGGSRNHLIFEAVLPNPDPGCGLAGCREIAVFWESLSAMEAPAQRAASLRRFFLDGLPAAGIPAAIRGAHFTTGTGQIRTNGFMRGPYAQRWQLREFKLAQVCSGEPPCTPVFVPLTVKHSPYGELFDENSAHPRGDLFRSHLLGQVENLAIDDLGGFFAEMPDFFNAGQSNSQVHEGDYPFHFAASPQLEADIQARLDALGSTLSPVHVVRRIMALSCAGCHQHNNDVPADDLGNGLVWPPSLGFVHVSELQTTTIDGSEHYLISPALESFFIPAREETFEDYLDEVACDDCDGCARSAPAPLPAGDVLVLDRRPDGGLSISAEALRALERAARAHGDGRTLGGTRFVH